SQRRSCNTGPRSHDSSKISVVVGSPVGAGDRVLEWRFVVDARGGAEDDLVAGRAGGQSVGCGPARSRAGVVQLGRAALGGSTGGAVPNARRDRAAPGDAVRDS